MKDLAALLQENPVFSALSADDRHIPKTRLLFYMAMSGLIFFWWERARSRRSKNPVTGAACMWLALARENCFGGLLFFHEDAPMPVTLQAREKSVLYLWAKDSVLPIILRNGRVSWEISRLIADRMQHASDLVEGLAFHPVAGRLARLLLDHFETAGDASILRYLTLDEMAARIGSIREMVYRALYSFSDKKLIEVTRTEFVLTDHEGLAQLSKRV